MHMLGLCCSAGHTHEGGPGRPEAASLVLLSHAAVGSAASRQPRALKLPPQLIMLGQEPGAGQGVGWRARELVCVWALR